ncbi:PREDICTED: cell division control protein 6 homolog B-like isoform X2 [Nelumbo nucifera]|uniref:Cell division control protein n=1 Tax=Nelumbo nucifera TaxID=4432 RepID=A0A1U8AJT2_NELNU|nr:PREDICTED: cell division control protein 6 homolog B-like isoform X2 [Nelumbo nucifera]
MPSLVGNGYSELYSGSDFAGRNENKEKKSAKVEKPDEIRSKGYSTPQKRRLRSATNHDSPVSIPSKPCSPDKWKSPRRCIKSSPNSVSNENCKESGNKLVKLHKTGKGSDNKLAESPKAGQESGDKLAGSPKSTRRRLYDSLPQKPIWNPKDSEQMSAVKKALHVSTTPCAIVCREEEQKRILDFCKSCIDQKKAGNLYISGCPGTGKTLSINKVKELLVEWAKEIFEKLHPRKKINGISPLQHLQRLFSQKQSSCEKMMLLIVDELDYLITRDRTVLHDLFMLATLPSSNCILIGIANAIDLADRFLPKLQPLNCEIILITFRAYSKDQILRILQQRLTALPYDVFQPQALELCARRVAAASGDMRKALCVCRNAIEMLEEELKNQSGSTSLLQAEQASPGQLISPVAELLKQEINIVRVDDMAIALSRTFKSAIVDTIQSLPQHQQMILCSLVKLFRKGKKDTTIGDLNKSYSEICKSALIPPTGILEFSNMCRVLSDQGLLKLGQSREDRLRRVTLKIDETDITFALQGIRFFRNCLH